MGRETMGNSVEGSSILTGGDESLGRGWIGKKKWRKVFLSRRRSNLRMQQQQLNNAGTLAPPNGGKTIAAGTVKIHSQILIKFFC